MAESIMLPRIRALTILLFFLSGASALAYEVTWVRELSLDFGVSVYAVTAVLSAFMGGLALGSWLFGRIASHYAAPLRLFAALQLGIGICALLSPFLFDVLGSVYVWLYNTLQPSFYIFNLLRFGLAGLVLMVPATLMGGSFPVIGQFLARRSARHASDLGMLYAANTFGGVVGTFTTGLLLIRFLGVYNTILLAAAIDLLVAGLAAYTSYSIAESSTASAPTDAGSETSSYRAGTSRRAQRFAESRARAVAAAQPAPEDIARQASDARLVWWSFALSGFIALGYEVVWTRLLAIFTLNTVYSFTIMLTTFLVGLALGSLLIARHADRVAEPLVLFGYLQLLIGLAAILMLFVFARLPAILLATVNVVTFRSEVLAEFLAGSVTMIIPTLLIGACFPVASRIYTAGTDRVGSRVGRLYGANTIGAMLGSFVAGFVLIPLLGLQRSVLLLATLNLLIGTAMLLRAGGRVRWQAGALLGGAALAAVLLPAGIYLGFQGTLANLVYYREGIDATVSVFEVKSPPLKVSFVDGRSEVPTDKASLAAFYLLGHLPPLLHPTAKSALMVSFGNGIATGAMARHKISQIHAVEIVAEQVKAAEFYRQENHDVLDYPGLEITIEDGRNYLLRSRETVDILTADATHPVNSSSWALFTREFYELARARLASDGVMVQWLPFHDLSEQDYRNIIKTFQSVFPHTTLWFTGGTHTFLVATPAPLTIEQIRALQPRIDAVGIADDLVSADRLAADLLMDEDEVRNYTTGASIVTDDNAFFIPAQDRERILASFEPYVEVAAEQAK